MRLLTWNSLDELVLTPDLHDDEVPPYAILSHTWGSDRDEVTFADLQQGRGSGKTGHQKIEFCGQQARKDQIKHFWVDTCCINKDNHVELSKAITCMFRWYRDAVKCYVYLSDVPALEHENGRSHDGWEADFRRCKWFTRGWTLQELLAPGVVEFFSREKEMLGDRTQLAPLIHEITTIPLVALYGNTALAQFPIDERIRWSQGRQTKEKEDRAYCLLGIFEVFMPLIYGEGDHALHRLRKEIQDRYGRDLAAHLGSSKDTHSRPIQSLGLCLGAAPVIDAGHFVGRAAEVDNIHHILHPVEASGEQRRVVIGGLGGMGKTQLTIAYARHYQQYYTSVLWLNATSDKTLKASFELVMRGILSAAELAQLSDEQIVARAHEWLSDPRNTQWLLIFDNYDEPDQFNINEYIPNIGHGSIIITTRLPDLVRGEQVRVQPLKDLRDSLAILQTRSQRANMDSGKSDSPKRRQKRRE